VPKILRWPKSIRIIVRILNKYYKMLDSTFTPNIKEIKIGRMSDCDIKVTDNGLSRY